jgi:7-carboxy-7-deazaguanine synthase
MKVNEIFGNTIQGEGPFAGHPAIFIRLFGCVTPFCSFCDTPYSWKSPSKEAHELTPQQILKKITTLNLDKQKIVIITGGEPFIQNEIYDLIYILQKNNFKIQVETSGKANIFLTKLNKYITPITIVMSPKQYNNKFKIVNPKTLLTANYYKFVVKTESDLKNVLKFIKKYNLPKNKTYLMSQGSTRKEQLQLIKQTINWCYKNNLLYSPRLHTLAYNLKRGI